MSGIRDKFKPAQLSVNREISKSTEKLVNRPRDGRPGFHDFNDGLNVFRICPPHDSNDPSMEPKCTVWLPNKVDELDKDKKPTGKKIIADRPIFNSKVHGGTKKDLVEEYINFTVKRIIDECQDKDERTRKLSPINGWRNKKDNVWHPGIRYSTTWIPYAFKNYKLGRVELYSKDKDRMEELNIAEEGDEPITTDCFSDPDNGVSLLITLGKDEKGNKIRVVAKREFNPKKFKTWDEFMDSEKLTDEQLEEFSKQPSLKSIYRNSFTRIDFEKQLEGLQIFDEKNQFNTFEDDEFLKVVEEINGYYPETNNDQNSDAQLEKDFEKGAQKRDEKLKKEAIKQQSEELPESEDLSEEKEDGDEFDKMDRKSLKQFIQKNGIPIIVKSDMDDKMIRERIREYNEENKTEESEDIKIMRISNSGKKVLSEEKETEEVGDLPFEKNDSKSSVKSKKEDEKAPVINTAIADKLAALRAKVSSKKF